MTVTANIHVGVSAWGSGQTIVTGNPRSNSGHVYRATSGGTSSVAPTHTSGTVTGGDGIGWKWLSAYDYSSLAAWDASIPSTLADAYVGLIWNHGEITLGSTFTINTKTTTSTFSITLKPAPGEGFKDAAGVPLYYNPANGVAINGSGGYADTLVVACDWVTVYGLQLKVSGSGNSNRSFQSNSRSGVTFDSIIALNNTSTNQIGLLFSSGTATKIINSLLIQRGSGKDGLYLGNNSIAVGCTIVKPTDITPGGTAFVGAYGTQTIRNCAAFGFTGTPPITGTTDGHNAKESTGGPLPGSTGNLTSVAYTTATFVQPSSASAPDFRLASGSALIGAGVTDATNNPGGLDILGTTRASPPAIGAHEFVSAGGGAAALAATPMNIATGTAGLSTSIRMAAAALGVVSATAALTTSIRLASARTVVATGTAGLTTTIRFAAAGGAVSTGTATFSGGAAALAASGSAVVTGAAALSTTIRLNASGQGVVTGSASLAGGGAALAAFTAAQATGLGALRGVSAALAANAQAQSFGSATLASIVIPTTPRVQVRFII